MSKEIELKSECLLSDAELLAVLERESAKTDAGYNTLDAMQWAQQALLTKVDGGSNSRLKSKEKQMTKTTSILSDDEFDKYVKKYFQDEFESEHTHDLWESWQAALTNKVETVDSEKELPSPNEIAPECWKTLVYELCNIEMMRRKQLSKSMIECMGKATGNRGKYPDPLEALAKLALSDGDDTIRRVKDQPDATSNAAPAGWQLIPTEPTEQQIIAAMEASLLGRPSLDDESYVLSIINAYLEAGKQIEKGDNKMTKTTPPRPRVTDDLVLLALNQRLPRNWQGDNKMTKTTPPRPRVTDDLVLLALEMHHTDKKDEWSFDDIVQEYCPSKDGYELMRSLERNCYWDGSRDLMDDLDAVDFSVNRIHKQAIKDWVTVYSVATELRVGDDVMWKSRKAKITNIYPDVAQYTIQFYEPYTERMPMTIGSSSAMYANFEDVVVCADCKEPNGAASSWSMD